MSKLKLLLLFLLLLTILALRFLIFYQSQPFYSDGDRISLRLTLQDEPVVNGQSQQISFKTARGQQLFIKTDTSMLLDFGQEIIVSGLVKEKQLKTGKSMLVLYYPKIIIEKEAANFLTAAAKHVRHESRKLYAQSLPPVSASLLMGIVFGIKEQ